MANEWEPQAGDSDKPSIRQVLHAATGDRDAEAEALAERAGDDVSADEAKTAVRRAHGDVPNDDTADDSDVATARDAEAAHEERTR
jgi:hypothetical protein